MKQALKYLSLIIIAISTTYSSYAQTYKWVKGGGTPTSMVSGSVKESVRYMCSDANGNVYAVSVTGNVGPLIADTFYKASGAYGSDQNIFLSSYDCNGVMRWAKLIGSSADQCLPYGITCDGLGHVYVAGYLTNSTLRIGYDTTITGLAYQTQGLIQFDTNGHFNWVRYVGDNTYATLYGALIYGSSIAVDGSDNVHFFCNMKYGVPITPTFTSHWGTYDLKYNQAGNFLGFKKLQFSDTTLYCKGIALDKPTDKLYVVGSVGSSYSSYGAHPFIASFDSNRNESWEDTISNPLSSSGAGAAFTGIVADEAGHIYASGGANRMVIYRSDTAINIFPTGAYIAFIMKFDTASSLNWIRNFSGTTSVNALYSLAMLSNNKIAAPGIIAGKIKSGTDSIVSYSGEGYNPYFTIIDTGGYVHELQQIHGSGSTNDAAYAIASDNSGNLYIGGQIESNAWGGTLTPYASTGGNSDFFVMKYGVDCSCTPGDMPEASFTDTGTLTRGFFYTGTTAAIDSVRWTFGDGSTSTLMNPIHTYLTADTFTACVRVYAPCGSDLFCKEIRIPCLSAPAPSFAMSGTGLTRTFTYTGTTIGVTSISWTFTDGGSGSGTPLIHTFSAAATYTACVTAVNPCGSTTTCNPISITCTSSPVSAYTMSGTGLTRTFTYTGTTTGMDSVTWTFSDGGTATGLTPMHTFAAAGTYTVCAKVYTNCGTHTYCNPVVITCVTSPTASYTYTGTDLTRSFTYTGTTAGMDSVRWNFGDATTSTVLSPTHTFSAAGTYTVCVTIYTNCGSHTFCAPVTVSCLIPPIASYTYSGSSDTRTFTYTGTTAGMDSVRWNFGDGGTSTLLSPTHIFTTEDTFHVCVTVYTNCGSHTSCQDVIVTCFLPITSAFADTGHLVHGFAYTGTLAGYDSVAWDYGDGSVDTGLVTIHTFATSDTYHICAKVYTNCGTNTYCRDIVVSVVSVPNVSSTNIKVYPNPSNEELYVTNVRDEIQYNLTNLLGQIVQRGTLHPGTNTISIHQLLPGVYALEILNNPMQKTVVKIIKQ
jgi:PKD repeat protein